MKKLLALLAVSGVVSIGGVRFLLVAPRPGVTRTDLVDAGLLDACDPVLLSCQGRDLCQATLADGGRSPRYGTVKVLGWQCDRPGNLSPALLIRWPRSGGRDCFEPVGPPDSACVVLGGSFDDGGAPAVQPDQDRCACRATGQPCRYQLDDGGTPLMAFGLTYAAPFAGAGCTRKVCVEVAGEQGQSMPEECQ